MGSNPIDHAILSTYTTPTFVNNTTYDFIITDISCDDVTFVTIDTVKVHLCVGAYAYNLTSGIKVSPGAVVSLATLSRYLSISGYYAHP